MTNVSTNSAFGATLIFDLDDTLIMCGKYYHETKLKGAKYLSDVTGISQDACLDAMGAIDLAATQQANPFSSARFPTSFAAAALALCHSVAKSRPEVIPYNDHMV